jgi:predicted metal-dependent phosphotriesterase family hydrolase
MMDFVESKFSRLAALIVDRCPLCGSLGVEAGQETALIYNGLFHKTGLVDMVRCTDTDCPLSKTKVKKSMWQGKDKYEDEYIVKEVGDDVKAKVFNSSAVKKIVAIGKVNRAWPA